MDIYNGETAVEGLAIGKIKLLFTDKVDIERQEVSDPDVEWTRLLVAKEKVEHDLTELEKKAEVEASEDEAAIFSVHNLMLNDQDYLESIENHIRCGKSDAEYAVVTTRDEFVQLFSQMDDDYMKERAIDIEDISNHLIAVLRGDDKQRYHLSEPSIIVAEDLAPSETMWLNKENILGIVTVRGSVNSHTAILARSMDLPALVRVDMPLTQELDGQLAIVDTQDSHIVINPDIETLDICRQRLQELEDNRSSLAALKGKANVTLDGRKIDIYANISEPADLDMVIENDAGGIGLFRSEFLYLCRHSLPSEDEQFTAYKTVAERMDGKEVIIRTLDIGADKQADFLNLEQEDNPALGYRAIRICLDRPEIFKPQVRAILRASAFGNVAIMYPMIISVDEVRRIKDFVSRIKVELDEEGLSYSDIQQGIMIETPAAAMISDLLAQEVDFFSIGTNDLTQYTLAVDRQNQKLGKLFDCRHDAILRLIELVVKNGHDAGIRVGICGEMGADLNMTETFLRLGVDELSVASPSILKVRQKVRELDLS
ncbi:MAG: phosphoenolpyruvate--protein phosphotransferase [Clostridiaceae bacterium]|nr:phosphoenolpyruvate--protein phosphotransferase [Clostridiaceae bacterium]